jgi:hypothetical protein
MIKRFAFVGLVLLAVAGFVLNPLGGPPLRGSLAQAADNWTNTGVAFDPISLATTGSAPPAISLTGASPFIGTTSTTAALGVSAGATAADVGGVQFTCAGCTATTTAVTHTGVLAIVQPAGANTYLLALLGGGTACTGATQCFSAIATTTNGGVTWTLNTAITTDGINFNHAVTTNGGIGICTGANAIVGFQNDGSNRGSVTCAGDWKYGGSSTGNLLGNANSGGKGEIASGGASALGAATANTGDIIIGGSSTVAPCGASNTCGGHLHQPANFTCAVTLAAGVCATGVPEAVHVTTSTNALTTLQVNFLQAFTNAPLCHIQDETTNITGWHVVVNSTTQVTFSIAGAAINDTFDAGCFLGNGA